MEAGLIGIIVATALSGGLSGRENATTQRQKWMANTVWDSTMNWSLVKVMMIDV